MAHGLCRVYAATGKGQTAPFLSVAHTTWHRLAGSVHGGTPAGAVGVDDLESLMAIAACPQL